MLPNETLQCFPAVPADLLIHSYQACGELAIGMEMVFGVHLDDGVFARASELLLDAEPILGCRLVIDAPVPHWQPVAPAARNVFAMTTSVDRYLEAWHANLDATTNVQVAICLLRRGAGDSLLIKMSHEVGDGAGLQYLVSRLSSIYSALCANFDYRPIANAVVERDLTLVLAHVPKVEYVRVLWDFVRFLAPRCWPRGTHTLPLPDESRGPRSWVMRRLPANQVALLSEYGRARGATLNDLFLAAAYRALASYGGWDGVSGLRIAMTVDLRRWCISKNHAGPVCNLSSFDCPFLIRNLGRDFEQTLSNVRTVMARRKRSRPGLALALLGRLQLKCEKVAAAVGKKNVRKRTRNPKAERGLTFSNEGALDRVDLRFGRDVPLSAHLLPSLSRLPRLHVGLSGYRGALTLSAVIPQNGRSIVEGFFDALLDELPAEPSENARDDDAAAFSATSEMLT